MKALTWEQAVRVMNEREQRTGRKIPGDRARGQRSRDLVGSDGTRDMEPGNHGRNVRATRPVTQVERQMQQSRRKAPVTSAYLACSGCGARVGKVDSGTVEVHRDHAGPLASAHLRTVKVWAHWDGTPMCAGADTIRVEADATPDRAEITPAPAARATRSTGHTASPGREVDAVKAFRRSLTPEQRRALDAQERAATVAERRRERGIGTVVIEADQRARRDMGAGAR
jgi:hypothetical protein